jgi:hypothetical protein
MHAKRVLGTVWLALVATPFVYAQEPAIDPVLAHFREYRAALESNDFEGAERAGVAALAASEAAGGSRMAVLALNLANLRLDLGGDRDALTPARTAYALASASPDTGVDPLAAALTLGRAELGTGDQAGVQRLLDAFAAAADKPELEPNVYDAAVALGNWAITATDYASARRAWETAAELAHTTDDPPFARARALTGIGTAIFLAGNDRSVMLRSQSRIERESTPDAQVADDVFREAQSLLAPLAFDAAEGQLTLGQAAYAQALAWQGALRAKSKSNDEELSDWSPIGVLAEGLCRMHLIADVGPGYPPEMLARFGVGAVVVLMGLDPSGAVTSRTLAAVVPPGPFGEAVMAVVDQWRVEKHPAAPAGCRMPSAWFVQVRFVVDP